MAVNIPPPDGMVARSIVVKSRGDEMAMLKSV
jgi:hypothetical protein